MSTDMERGDAPATKAGGRGGSGGGNAGVLAAPGGKRGKSARGSRPGPFARVAIYYREVREQLSKVITPTRTELTTYVTVVLVFVTTMVLIVSGMDLLLTKGVLFLFK